MTVPDAGGPAPTAPGPDAWAGRVRRLFLPVTVVVLGLAAVVVPLPAFIELPGSAAGIPACVALERPSAPVNGDFLLTTIGQRDATVAGLLVAAVRDDQRIVPKRDLLGGERRDRYLARQREVFVDATDRAIVVGLRAAGLPVDVVGEGADVVEVIADTPADGVLQPGDVITAVDGVPVTTDTELVAAIVAPDPLTVRLRRQGTERTAELTPQVRVIDGEERPVIGVRITTSAPRVQLPFDVEVASGRVGGPSAGLMIGLAVHDLVTDDDLARGRRIAGTGTLALDGTVGAIDGIDLKVAAASRAGADVFVAPAAQAGDARAAVPAGSGLTVVAVDTFDDARTALRADEGSGDAANVDVATAPPACPFAADA